MDIDPKNLKRDNWTNEEVLNLLNEMEFYYKCDKPEPEKFQRSEEYTQAIEDVREIFEAFKASEIITNCGGYVKIRTF